MCCSPALAALHAERAFSDGDLTQLANLCHNCRGCYYACQYTAPHEFALNLPQALANVRQDSWEEFAFPRVAGQAFQKSGLRIALATVLGFALLIWAMLSLASAGGEAFLRGHGAQHDGGDLPACLPVPAT